MKLRSKNTNSTINALLRSISLILLSFTVSAAIFAEELNIPDIGESAATTLTLADEKLLGESVVRSIRRAGKLVTDPLLTSYINDLGNQLVSVSNNKYYRFKFFVVDDKTINAFALPGGFVGVHYGLILATRNESELASVLAHEVAHVTQRHHARRFELADKYSVPVIAALVASILLAASGSELGQAALASVAGGQAALSVDFTRRNEKEADRLGIQMLNKAGYDAHSMASFFEQMYKESRLYGSQGPEFLRTHPISQNRMAEAKLRANQLSLKQPPSSEMYFLMKERIHLLNEPDNKRLLEYYKSQITRGTYTRKNAALYGYAVSLFKNNQFGDAKKIISELRKQNPSKIAYIIGDAKVAEQAKDYSQAAKIYARALDDFPSNEALILNYVELLIKQKDYAKAKSILKVQLRHETTLPILYKLLAEIEAKLGNNAASHEIMSKYFYNIGQIHQALNRINIALKSPHLDFYTESRLSARQRELEYEIRAVNNDHS